MTGIETDDDAQRVAASSNGIYAGVLESFIAQAQGEVPHVQFRVLKVFKGTAKPGDLLTLPPYDPCFSPLLLMANSDRNPIVLINDANGAIWSVLTDDRQFSRWQRRGIITEMPAAPVSSSRGQRKLFLILAGIAIAAGIAWAIIGQIRNARAMRRMGHY